jgi:TetR/AcrR family fatty acid metabolism transcriptional regulator
MVSADEHLLQRRREILTAAEKVFAAKGYAAATVDEVAAAAGVSKGTMYNYFENKRDLFHQVFSEMIAGEESDVAELIARPLSGQEKLRKILALWVNRLERYKGIGRLVLEFWATAAREEQGGELASWFNQMYTRWRNRIAGVIAQGIDEEEFRKDLDPTVAAALILAILDGIEVQTILDLGLTVDDEFVGSLGRAIFVALTGRPPDEAHSA